MYELVLTKRRVLAGLLVAWPWATLTIGLLIYVATIPVAVVVHHPHAKRERLAEKKAQKAA